MSFKKEKSVRVAAPPEAVFDYVSDIKRHPEWAMHQMVMRERGDGTFESTVKVMNLEPRTVIHVETRDRPRRFTFLCDDNTVGQYRWTFDITPDGAGSRIKYGMERLHAPLWVQLTQAWMLWPTDGRRGVITGLANIKRALETTEMQPVAQPPQK